MHTHGQTKTREYQTWDRMIQRCTNPKNISYPNYGGRGIKVCTLWMQYYEEFRAHVGPRPSDAHSLERINNSKGYEPGNVRWATRAEQARNRRNSRLIKIGGITKCFADWCKMYNLNPQTVEKRVNRGIIFELALVMRPERKRKKKKPVKTISPEAAGSASLPGESPSRERKP